MRPLTSYRIYVATTLSLLSAPSWAQSNTSAENVQSGNVRDFSIAHGLMNVPIIRNLLRSGNSSQRKIAWKMIKNATILADLTGNVYKTNP